VFLEKLFRAFFPPFFGHDIRVNIKNDFSQFLLRFFPNIFCSHYFALFCDDFSQNFLPALLVCFWKNCFPRFFPPFFGHDIRVNIKNVFSQFFTTIFIPTFFAGTIGLFLEKLFRGFFPPF